MLCVEWNTIRDPIFIQQSLLLGLFSGQLWQPRLPLYRQLVSIFFVLRFKSHLLSWQKWNYFFILAMFEVLKSSYNIILIHVLRIFYPGVKNNHGFIQWRHPPIIDASMTGWHTKARVTCLHTTCQWRTMMHR